MLWVGQFGILEGEAKEETPWVGTFREQTRSEDSSDLYLVVEPALPGSDEFCQELKEAIGDAFHRSKASLTGGLLRALKGAHENLRDWNRRSLKEHRVAAGVTCLAVRANEAYLAQVAPAAAVLYRQGSLLPLQPTLPDALEPLGLHDEFWPDFRRIELVEGDRLLIMSTALSRAIEPRDLAAALELPGEESLPAVYRLARSLSNCGAVLVAEMNGGEEPAP